MSKAFDEAIAAIREIDPHKAELLEMQYKLEEAEAKSAAAEAVATQSAGKGGKRMTGDDWDAAIAAYQKHEQELKDLGGKPV